MSVKIPNTRSLQTTLTTMRSAQMQRVNMNIWDQDIKAVESALEFIEAMRRTSEHSRPSQNSEAK